MEREDEADGVVAGARDAVVSGMLLPIRDRWSDSRIQEFVSKTQPDGETRCHLPMLKFPPGVTWEFADLHNELNMRAGLLSVI